MKKLTMDIPSNLTKYKIDELTKDYLKYEKYIYSILGTPNHHSKVNASKNKANIYDAHMLAMDFDDLVQHGRMLIWEALIKYGTFPKKSHSSKPRMVSSKSTFVYRHLLNRFINLGIKSSSAKFKRTDIDISKIQNLYESLVDDTTPEDILMFKQCYGDRIQKEEQTNNKFLKKIGK